MPNIRETDFYKEMNLYHACECAEEFGSGESVSREEYLAAWQYIYDTNAYKVLQGYYGRMIQAMIQQGLIITDNRPYGNEVKDESAASM